MSVNVMTLISTTKAQNAFLLSGFGVSACGSLCCVFICCSDTYMVKSFYAALGVVGVRL